MTKFVTVEMYKYYIYTIITITGNPLLHTCVVFKKNNKGMPMILKQGIKMFLIINSLLCQNFIKI